MSVVCYFPEDDVPDDELSGVEERAAGKKRLINQAEGGAERGGAKRVKRTGIEADVTKSPAEGEESKEVDSDVEREPDGEEIGKGFLWHANVS